MSRKTLRAALSDWFGNGHVLGLTAVLPSIKSVTAASSFIANPGDTYGALGEIFIRHEEDRRISPPSGSGIKHVVYEVALGVRFVFIGDAADAIDPYDDLIEAIKVRARTDPRVGQPDTVIWQFGEGDGNATPDVRVDSFYPETMQENTVLIWSEVWFVVKEEIRA